MIGIAFRFSSGDGGGRSPATANAVAPHGDIPVPLRIRIERIPRARIDPPATLLEHERGSAVGAGRVRRRLQARVPRQLLRDLLVVPVGAIFPRPKRLPRAVGAGAEARLAQSSGRAAANRAAGRRRLARCRVSRTTPYCMRYSGDSRGSESSARLMRASESCSRAAPVGGDGVRGEGPLEAGEEAVQRRRRRGGATPPSPSGRR